VGIAFYFEDLDGAVRGAGCEAAAVVVEDCVVLLKRVSCVLQEERGVAKGREDCFWRED
jgi:hypothetical protein